MEWYYWSAIAAAALYAVFRIFAFVTGRVQTGRAIEAFVIGVKAPQVAQDLAWWHRDGGRFMVSAGYTMGTCYSKKDPEAKYMDSIELLAIGAEICTVESVTEFGQRLESLPKRRKS